MSERIEIVIINNFKSISSASFAFKPLTILTGLNSSGKSSLIQFLRITDALLFNKGIHKHGAYDDLRYRYAEKNEHITGSVVIKNFENFEPSAYAVAYNNERLILSRSNDTYWKFSFLSADRLGPQVTLAAPKELVPNSVGERGEFVVPFCIQRLYERGFKDNPRLHQSADGDTFDHNLDAWMNEICPGLKIHPAWDKQIDTSYYQLGNKSDPTIKERPTHVGFGISYTLPVVAQLLGAEKGDIVCIENPEAHLHPLGQTRLGELIAKTAQSGVQVIIETHSDHLIDGMRIAVKEKHLPHDQVAVFYFSKNQENVTEYIHLTVQEDGDMSDWPQGFFDQSVKNLSKLAKF